MTSRRKGLLLTLEGVEGSGKSLQMRRIEAYLKDKRMRCLVTLEPGGTEFGRALRRVLLHKGSAPREPLRSRSPTGRSFWIWSLKSDWPALETETNWRGLPSRKGGSRRRSSHFT